MLEDAGHVVIVDEDDGETFTLALEEASAQDSGKYKCVATNKAGTLTTAASLKVEGELPDDKKGEPDGQVKDDLLVPKSAEEIVGKSIELVVEGRSLKHFNILERIVLF